MAVARQLDPGGLARAFADEISSIPEVARIWYWSAFGNAVPGTLTLDVFVLLSRSDDRIEAAVTDATMRFSEAWPNLMLGVATFAEDRLGEGGVDGEVPEDAQEIAVWGVTR